MALTFLCLGLGIHGPSWAETFRCHDATGKTVLTDSPAQLHSCETLPAASPPAGESREAVLAPKTLGSHPGKDPYEELGGVETEESLPTGPAMDALPTEDPIATVPVHKQGGSLVVPVRINGARAARLIIDTGATMTVLSSTIAMELGLIATTQTELATVNTAGGPIQVNMTHVKSLQVGSAKAENVAVAIHDLPDGSPDIDGLLGLSFLKHFLVTLDPDNGRLQLHPRP